MKTTGSKLLLDTNAVIDYFKGNPAIIAKLKKAKVLFIPSIVLGELYFGANNSSNKRKHTRQISKFLTLCEILQVDWTTAIHYGSIKANLKKKGNPSLRMTFGLHPSPNSTNYPFLQTIDTSMKLRR